MAFAPRTGSLRRGALSAVHALVVVLTAACTPFGPSASDQPAADGGPLSASIAVRFAPIGVLAEGRVQLVYELHIRDLSEPGLALTSAEAIANDGASPSARDRRFDISSEAIRRLEVVPGSATEMIALYVWLDFDRSEVPAALRHRVTLQSADGRTAVIEGGAVTVRSEAAAVIGPPLLGANWIATNGPSNDSGHRQALLGVVGGEGISQRFATDFVRTDPALPFRPGAGSDGGERLLNRSHFAYGADVLAVADGTVTAAVTGVPDNTPDALPVPPLFGDALAGNYVIIMFGPQRYAVYAHLRPGSITVKEGQRVSRGQVIARVGNSGFSSKPHLHFHVSDADGPLAGEGLPYVFERFDHLGRLETDEQTIDHSQRGTREHELALSGTVIRFGPPAEGAVQASVPAEAASPR